MRCVPWFYGFQGGAPSNSDITELGHGNKSFDEIMRWKNTIQERNSKKDNLENFIKLFELFDFEVGMAIEILLYFRF